MITRDSSFSTGELELDVGALFRAGENIEAVQAGLDELGARRELLDAVAEAEEGLASFGLAAIEGGNGLTGNVLLGQAADLRGDVFQDLVAELGGLSGSLSDLDRDTLMRLVGVNLDDSVSEAAAEIERLGLTAQVRDEKGAFGVLCKIFICLDVTDLGVPEALQRHHDAIEEQFIDADPNDPVPGLTSIDLSRQTMLTGIDLEMRAGTEAIVDGGATVALNALLAAGPVDEVTNAARAAGLADEAAEGVARGADDVIRRFSAEELQGAADRLHSLNARGESVITITQTPNGRVIVSANNQVPSQAQIAESRRLFGDNVEIVRGTTRTNAPGPTGNHAEQRGIQHAGEDAAGSLQASSHNACDGCVTAQSQAGVTNVTGSAADNGGVFSRPRDPSKAPNSQD